METNSLERPLAKDGTHRGRKPMYDEIKRKRVIDLSQQTIIRALVAPDDIVPLVEKARIALPIVVRLIPQKIDVDTNGLQNNLMLLFAGSSMPKTEIESKLAILTGQTGKLADDRAA